MLLEGLDMKTVFCKQERQKRSERFGRMEFPSYGELWEQVRMKYYLLS